MPGIGSLPREIDVNNLKKSKQLLRSKTNARVLSVKTWGYILNDRRLGGHYVPYFCLSSLVCSSVIY